MVRSPGECIRLAHGFAGLVMEREVEAGQVERPSGLVPVELLRHPEVFQILVICSDLKLVPGTFQEVSPLL